jgi:hypothetical protein
VGAAPSTGSVAGAIDDVVHTGGAPRLELMAELDGGVCGGLADLRRLRDASLQLVRLKVNRSWSSSTRASFSESSCRKAG